MINISIRAERIFNEIGEPTRNIEYWKEISKEEFELLALLSSFIRIDENIKSKDKCLYERYIKSILRGW